MPAGATDHRRPARLITMVSDLLMQIMTPCSPAIRHLGYVQETAAMRNRYLRRRSAWQSHLDNTRRFLLDAADRCRNRERMVLIGSGLLLDVPLERLAELFREVVFMDVVCLPQIRRQIKRNSNVSFIEHDVTGIAEQLYRNKKAGIRQLPEPAGISPELYGDTDLVVSLNILSQLWVMPRAYVLQKMPELGDEHIDQWCSRIVIAHYTALRALNCSVCLIADFEYVKRDIEGKTFGKASTVYGLPLPEPDTHWTWQIAPLGEESLYYSRELNVGAWHLR